jgi:predicted Ser/Thr protein kinase
MADIKFDKDTLEKVNNKMGIYSGLRKPIQKVEDRPLTLRIVEDAFRAYAWDHKGITAKQVEQYWKQYKKYLDKELQS